MGNIIDYIKTYGDLDFSQKSFTAVDGLILSQFSYLKLDGIVPCVGENSDSIELRDIAVHARYEDLYADERYAKNNREFFEALALTRRFGLIKLNHYINLISTKWEMQFSAICCYLPEGDTCIVYRGTDENIISWKEDFNMAFMDRIPAQTKALDYMNYAAERIVGDFIVAGHSKGGNLAVFAAMMCPEDTEKRISRVYSYDGPGFLKTAFSESDFDKINEKLIKLVPHSSIVGMLLQNQEKYSAVESRNFGIFQHDPFNWIVEEDDFIYRDDIGDIAALHDDSINEWATSMDPEKMRAFSNQLFDVLMECGINDLNDFKGNYADILKKFALAVDQMDEEQKNLMKQVVKSLFDAFIETVKGQPGILKSSERDKSSKKDT